MMISSSIVPDNLSILKISKSYFATRSRRVNLTWPAIRVSCGSEIEVAPTLVPRAHEQPTQAILLQPEQENQKDERKVSDESNGAGAPTPNILSMTKWFLGSFVMIVPFYQNFLSIEGIIVRDATVTLYVVEKLAEEVEKKAEDAARSLPEDSKLKKIALRVDKIAEEVDKDAKILESWVEKVDETVENFDMMVETIIDAKNAFRQSRKK